MFQCFFDVNNLELFSSDQEIFKIPSKNVFHYLKLGDVVTHIDAMDLVHQFHVSNLLGENTFQKFDCTQSVILFEIID